MRTHAHLVINPRSGELADGPRAVRVGARPRNRVNGQAVAARVLLVGNNRYELTLFTLGVRERLDGGELQVWAATGILPTAWEERACARFRIELPGRTVRAAIDSEPATLELPLELESLPGALRVLVP